MYDTISFYTFIVLVAFFVFIEIYRFKHFVKGTVIEFYTPDLEVENLISTQMKVRLKNGETIKAEAFRCTMCLGQINIGDEVNISYSKNKFIVNLPFRWRKIQVKHNTCC